MLKDKSCSEGKVINDRLIRTRQALLLGRRVVPQTVDQILNNLVKYEQVMPQVKKAYKCTTF
jgi:hypothetical protein